MPAFFVSEHVREIWQVADRAAIGSPRVGLEQFP
jgi:hypothetical protein